MLISHLQSRLSSMILMALLLVAHQSEAIVLDWEGTASFVAGYRNDQIKSTVVAYNPPTLLDEPFGFFLLRDEFKARNLHVYEIGAKGIAVFCDGWLVKGYGLVGVMDDGCYAENTFRFPDARFNTKAKVHHGRTTDVSFAIGYLAKSWKGGSLCEIANFFGFANLDIGPVAGWAYDTQKFKIGKARTNNRCNDFLSSLSVKNTWRGPWLGADLYFTWCAFDFNLSYEYHWAKWHEDWTLEGPDTSIGFSDHRRNHKYGSGNVVVFGTAYSFCESLSLGLDLKWQHWSVERGVEKPHSGSFASVGFGSFEVDKVPKSTWSSLGLQVNVGWNF